MHKDTVIYIQIHIRPEIPHELRSALCKDKRQRVSVSKKALDRGNSLVIVVSVLLLRIRNCAVNCNISTVMFLYICFIGSFISHKKCFFI